MGDELIRQGEIAVVEPANDDRCVLCNLLEQTGFQHVSPHASIDGALASFRSRRPDMMLLSVTGSSRDCFDPLEQIRAMYPDDGVLPVLVLTADASVASRRMALSCGANDYLTKPIDALEVLLRVKNLLRLRFMQSELRLQNDQLDRKVRERTRELEDTYIEILERLGFATEFRDDNTGAHTSRVGEMAGAIARQLALDPKQVWMIRLAAPLHDLGKVGIPDSILLKAGRLSDDEIEQMQRHTLIGQGILAGSRSELLQVAEEIAVSHHERWDGTGYPHGLAGEDIPLSGRIVAVADVFDALTNSRPYKSAWPVWEAIEEIRALSGKHFDPAVVEAFLAVVSDQFAHLEPSIAI